jgi:hypothetical protein
MITLQSCRPCLWIPKDVNQMSELFIYVYNDEAFHVIPRRSVYVYIYSVCIYMYIVCMYVAFVDTPSPSRSEYIQTCIHALACKYILLLLTIHLLTIHLLSVTMHLLTIHLLSVTMHLLNSINM